MYFLPFKDSSHHHVVYVLPAGAFFLEKARPWNFGACICWILSIFADFRVPPTIPWSMCLPQGLFFSQKTRPWNFGACLLWILWILLKIGRPLPRNVSNSRNCSHKSAFWNLHSGPGGPTEVVAWSAARTLPSTRAGGQDDVSFTNSLKLFRLSVDIYRRDILLIVQVDILAKVLYFQELPNKSDFGKWLGAIQHVFL